MWNWPNHPKFVTYGPFLNKSWRKVSVSNINVNDIFITYLLYPPYEVRTGDTMV